MRERVSADQGLTQIGFQAQTCVGSRRSLSAGRRGLVHGRNSRVTSLTTRMHGRSRPVHHGDRYSEADGSSVPLPTPQGSTVRERRSIGSSIIVAVPG